MKECKEWINMRRKLHKIINHIDQFQLYLLDITNFELLWKWIVCSHTLRYEKKKKLEICLAKEMPISDVNNNFIAIDIIHFCDITMSARTLYRHFLPDSQHYVVWFRFFSAFFFAFFFFRESIFSNSFSSQTLTTIASCY